MLEKSFGLLFYLRKPKNYQGGPSTIYLRITVNGVSNEISSKRKCEPTQWSARAGRSIGNKEANKELNRYLDVLEQKVFQAKGILIDKDKEVTAEGIKMLLNGTEDKKVMILDVFRHHNDQMKAQEGTSSPPTRLIGITPQ